MTLGVVKEKMYISCFEHLGNKITLISYLKYNCQHFIWAL